MPRITANLAFYHPPKTGGTWVRQAVQQVTQWKGKVGSTHDTPGTVDKMRGTAVDQGLEDRFRFTVVRDPRAWLASVYRYHCQLGRLPDPTGWLYDLPRDSFEIFAQSYLRERVGLVTRIFKYYSGPCDFVARTETILDDLHVVLCAAGHVCERADLDLPPENVSSRDRPAAWPPDLAKELMEKEPYYAGFPHGFRGR